jgi:hypothetical protein
MSTLLLLLGLIIIVIGVLVYQKMTLKAEGFTDTTATQLSFCPVNTTAYLNLDGDTECCDGRVTMNECMGTPICAISTTSSLPPCSEIQATYYKIQANDKCPPSMPLYYEGIGGGSGCASMLNDTKNGPVNNGTPQCTIYKDMPTNYSDSTSCYNAMNLETISDRAKKLFDSNGVTTSYLTSALTPQKIGNQVLHMVQVSYNQTPTSTPTTCYYASDLAIMINLQKQNGLMNADEASAKTTALSKGVYYGECSAMAAVYTTKSLAPTDLISS